MFINANLATVCHSTGNYWSASSFSLDHFYNDLVDKPILLFLSARLILYSKQFIYSPHMSSVTHNLSFNSSLCFLAEDLLRCSYA